MMDECVKKAMVDLWRKAEVFAEYRCTQELAVCALRCFTASSVGLGAVVGGVWAASERILGGDALLLGSAIVVALVACGVMMSIRSWRWWSAAARLRTFGFLLKKLEGRDNVGSEDVRTAWAELLRDKDTSAGLRAFITSTAEERGWDVTGGAAP